MFNEPFAYQELENHVDQRGNLFEMLKFKQWDIPGDGHIYCFSVAPGTRRGDHYHEKKREWLTCVSGVVSVLLEAADGTTKEYTLSAEVPAIVYMGPPTVHAIVNRSATPAFLVAYGSIEFDPQNTDTFPKIVPL